MFYVTNRNNLWNPLAEIHREMDRAFDNDRNTNSVWSPACDVAVEDGHYLLSVELPGIPRDDIKIEVADNTVTISGERRFENKKRENGSWYGEQRYGKFMRSFSLPSGVDSEQIEANHLDGVLHLIVPKAEKAKRREIKISSGTGLFGKLLGDNRKRDEAGTNKDRVA